MNIRNLLLLLLLAALEANSQTTAFSYQGSLTEGGIRANGAYIMEFKLFGTLGGADQIGATISNVAVTATDGIFTTRLDFGSNAFAGADRFLEVAVKKLPADPYTVLSPRQQIASSPYAIQTIKAQQADVATTAQQANMALDSQKLGGLPASDYVTTASVGNAFVKNTSIPQTASFNVTGDGTVGGLLFAQTMRTGSIDAINQYNIEGNRVLSIRGTDNLFVGVGAGENNTTVGNGNSFFGAGAGQSNTNGGANSFFGRFAGTQNTQGSLNSFFGERAGRSNTLADNNSIFGARAGSLTDTGGSNSFFGAEAGFLNTSGASNTFMGYQAGTSSLGSFNSFFGANSGQNNTGNNNTFFGYQVGMSNGPGSNNTLLGSGANVGGPNLTNATAIGAGALVGSSNTLVLGRSMDKVRVPGSMDIFGPVAGAFVLAPINGGTGLNSAGASGNFLRSSGGSWSSSLLQSSDIPSGSNHYIQNTAALQTANFNISGDGFIGSRLGVGTIAPSFPFRLDVAGPLRTYDLGSNVLSVEAFGGTSSGAELTLKTIGRAWTLGTRRGVDDNQFYIAENFGGLPLARLTIKPNNGPIVLGGGNVGIGTDTPNAKLFVEGGFNNGAGIVGIAATENTTQSPDKGGWIKAALFIDGGGNLHSCYNGVTGASTSGCGFTVVRQFEGQYRITLPFTPRFATASVWLEGTPFGAGAMLNFAPTTNDIRVTTYIAYDIDGTGGIVDKSFMLIVF